MGIFGNAFGWPHLILIVAVILLVFGATRLPALAKSVGQSMKIFKNEIKTDDSGKAESVEAGTDEGVKADATVKPDASSPSTASK
ncbi:twin-arginine translocase TatA/TatE family subunit [Pseudolysinimonas sp.]|uniref:twin-arginine translocase TatA/TatE family subunit n=1 Tax=Pseudolysinimonas sp. TaxID=2680009 RepID=UPI003F7E3CAD